MDKPRKSSVRNRQSKTAEAAMKTEAAMEAYINNVEPLRADEMTVEQRVTKRAQGRYFNATSYRTTEAQKELLKYAAKQSGKSVQQYMEDILMFETERQFGVEYDKQF